MDLNPKTYIGTIITEEGTIDVELTATHIKEAKELFQEQYGLQNIRTIVLKSENTN